MTEYDSVLEFSGELIAKRAARGIRDSARVSHTEIHVDKRHGSLLTTTMQDELPAKGASPILVNHRQRLWSSGRRSSYKGCS